MLARFRTALADTRGAVVPFGAIGRFRRQGRGLTFVVGEALRRAAAGQGSLPEGDAGTVFGAALAVARTGRVAEVDGAFALWTWKRPGRDWLGRDVGTVEVSVEPATPARAR